MDRKRSGTVALLPDIIVTDVTMPIDDADNGRVGDDPPLESGGSDFARPNDGSDFPAEHPWVDWLSQDPRELCLSECPLL
jgi:hypothetical protein